MYTVRPPPGHPDNNRVKNLPFADLPCGMNFVTVFAMIAGYMFMPESFALANGSSTHHIRVPSLAFYIEHPNGKKAMFDLGMRKDTESNPPMIKRLMHETWKPTVPKDPRDYLEEARMAHESIDYIFISHPHFDHSGDIYRFPKSQLVVGQGTLAHVGNAWPTNPNGSYRSDSIKLTDGRNTTEIEYTDKMVGAFETTFDFFGDGSFILVDAPGHCAGHMLALARISPTQYVLFGGDAAHHRDIYRQLTKPGVFDLGNGHAVSVHNDFDEAWSTILKIHRASLESNVMVLLAHDHQLLPEGLPLFPHALNGWVIDQMNA
ncbi:hypothetical protein SeLEV6574_g03639 [Synchytrium endobioticum]|uniref:Metallo-beta-lactamase domain-containing protein n=1 Tax=Synchytrium endobioticum TaxID=286115 RepID=A0A507D2Q4_9FUNG|nr:hypothetical protein SeLEV6574_g03639 [Synchytrium endobioticum]